MKMPRARRRSRATANGSTDMFQWRRSGFASASTAVFQSMPAGTWASPGRSPFGSDGRSE